MRSRAAASVAAIFLLSCTERQPSAPQQGATLPPSTAAPATSIQRLLCTGRVDTKVVSCALPKPDVQADLIMGGQGTYVQLTSSNVNYNSGTSIFSFDVTVQNLIPQTLGTNDGVTPDTGGVKVFFSQEPTVLTGTGPISVANPDGQGSFTGTNQDYFAYKGADLGPDNILVQNETSSTKNWQLSVDPGVNSFEFAVYVNTNVRYPNGYVDVSTPSPYLNQTLTQTVTATSRTVVGNAVPGSTITYASTAPAVATVDPSTGQITAVAPGIATINVTSTESTTGSLTVQVCPNLLVGEVYTTSDAAGQNVCFGGGAAAQEYTMIPMNTATTGSLSLTVTGTGIQAVTGPPTPDRIPTQALSARIASGASITPFADESYVSSHVGSPEASGIPPEAFSWLHRRGGIKAVTNAPAPREDDFAPESESDAEGVFAANGAQQRLRWYPTETVQGTVAVDTKDNGSAGFALATTESYAPPTVGDIVQYNTNSACSGSPSVRTGMVRSVSASAVIVSDTANPTGGFTTAQYDSIALEFDTIAYKVVSTNFGQPTDNDNNSRVILFFTRAINELSPPASSTVTQAVFASKDVFGTDDCSNSNGQATVGTEILYMLAPDPTGVVNSNVRTVSFVRGGVVMQAGHELQHLVNGQRRAYVTGASFFETGFLNEALSAAAEELMFYRASGMVPGSNVGPGTNAVSGVQLNSKRVTAYNSYQSQQIGKFRPWLQRPDTSGFMGQGVTTASLSRIGFGGAFLRYSADRRAVADSTFFFALVNSNLEGVPNIQNAIGGASPNDWMRDFEIALYADDNAFTVAPEYRTQSWNYRALYALLFGSYSLLPRPLTNGAASTLAYKAGGASAYYRFGVAATGFAKLTATNPSPIANVRFSWLRTK
jgi:hypothetical protein